LAGEFFGDIFYHRIGLFFFERKDDGMTPKTVVCIFLVLTLSIAGCVPSTSVSLPTKEPDYWPTTEWRGSTPEAQGMDSEHFAEMLESIAALHLQGYPVLEIGLDNVYRLSSVESIGELLLRGRWADEQTFLIDYPYPIQVAPVLGELGETELQFKFIRNTIEVTVQQLVFGGEPITFEGTR
jgi:hypothetical protein